MSPTGCGALPCDFMLRGAGELVTMAPGSVPGAEGDLGIVRDGALTARGGRIVWVGPERELAGAAALAPDHGALEQLDPLAGALDHPDVDLQGVAGSEVGDVVAQLAAVDKIGFVHRE